MAWNVHLHYSAHFVTHHSQHALVHIHAFKHGAAISIDHFTLLGNYIVIIDHVLTDIEVVSLNPGLCLFDEARNHAALKRHIFVHPNHLHHFRYAVSGKAAHQLIVQCQEEARRAWIPLPPGTTSQLAIDTP